jgi:microcystin-dependent protein
MPSHTHTLVASTLAADNTVPTSRLFAVPASPVVDYLVGTPTVGTVTPLDPDMLRPAGESGAHSNLMPTVALNYIICTQGIFPVTN